MGQLKQLLTGLERISYQDTFEIPKKIQHEVAEPIEQLQNNLSTLIPLKKNIVNTLYYKVR